MKIAVCVKQVPTREWQPRLNDTGRWIREQDASFEMNEPDAYALEEGLRLRERHGGEVVVCSALPANVKVYEIPNYPNRYAYVNGRTVLVEPGSNKIVYVYR